MHLSRAHNYVIDNIALRLRQQSAASIVYRKLFVGQANYRSFVLPRRRKYSR